MKKTLITLITVAACAASTMALAGSVALYFTNMPNWVPDANVDTPALDINSVPVYQNLDSVDYQGRAAAYTIKHIAAGSQVTVSYGHNSEPLAPCGATTTKNAVYALTWVNPHTDQESLKCTQVK